MSEVKKQWNGSKDNINREGRPDAGWTWRDLFMKIADQKKDQLTNKELAAKKIWDKMQKDGDIKAFEKIVDRMEGKAPQYIDHTSDGEKIEGFVLEFVKPHEAKNKDTP